MYTIETEAEEIRKAQSVAAALTLAERNSRPEVLASLIEQRAKVTADVAMLVAMAVAPMPSVRPRSQRRTSSTLGFLRNGAWR